MVVLAELTVYCSRPIAPTRRVALGPSRLPCDPPPGFGGVLLGAVVAAHAQDLDPELQPDLLRLTVQLEEGQRIPQPRLRYRFQTDRVGLLESRHRLLGDGEALAYDHDERGTPAQQVLGAVYAAGMLPVGVRHAVMTTIRRAMRWVGPVGPDLLASLATGRGAGSARAAFEDPVTWALEQLGLPRPNGSGVPERAEVLRRFRRLLREAHPDHGAEPEGAAQRIADLTEARRILLAD
jgi:hypothetical protein